MTTRQSTFDFISSYCESRFSVEKYQSNQTGMKLYHINVPLPLVKLEICVQTRPSDDTGCPHTLEHLIFMGSEKYPQQGYLDHIASQCYSLGTNATTYRDMTTYELTTVNAQSINTLLPIYLDHVFNPLLTKECYLTEVHHISGETGEDAGVVYSEIQASENQAEEILLFSIMRDLWNEKTPYYYESGGRLESIRNELNLEKIKLFHQKFYKPKNVAIVLCGAGVKIDEILNLLTKFEEENFLSVSTKRLLNEQQRKKVKYHNEQKSPWIQIKQASFDGPSSSTDNTLTNSNPPAVDTTKLSVQLTNVDGNESSFCDSELMVSNNDSSSPSSPSTSLMQNEFDPTVSTRQMNEYKQIYYPVEDNEENLGQVAFAYRLESIYNMEIYTSLDVLLTTLFDEDISIFYKEFIEMPNTLCSTIDHDWFNYPERVLTITFEGIDVEHLTMVADKFTSVLYSIVNATVKNDELLIQIQRNIQKKIELHLNEIENEPLDYLTDLCCLDHISELSLPKSNENDDEEDHLNKFLRNKKYLEDLNSRPLTFWTELIRKYLLEWDSSKRTIILLKPSNDLLSEQQEQEEQRLVDRRQRLGVEGLTKLKDELIRARTTNSHSASQCGQIESPRISFNDQLILPPIEFYSSESSIDLFHSPTSQFNRFVLHIPFDQVPIDLQIYLPLFSYLLFHTSIRTDQIQLSKYQFCAMINRDVLDYSVSFGQTSSSPIQSNYVGGHYITRLIISLQTLSNTEIYQNTFNYFRYVLFGSEFDDFKIIQEECEKQLKNLIETLQDGQTTHQAYFNSLIYSNQSSHYYHRMNLFVQKNLLEKICKHPEKYRQEILTNLQRLKTFLRKNLSQLHLTICGNMNLIRTHWNFVESFLVDVQRQSQFQFEDFSTNEKKICQIPSLVPATIIGSPHEESAYVLRWSRLQIQPQDFAQLLIFSNYLDMENGPLWNACRTNGFAYGVAFDFDFETNLVLLSINQCSQVKLAFVSAMNMLKDLIESRLQIDWKRIEAARNLTVCMLTEHLATLGRAANVSIRSYLHTYSIDKYQELLSEIHRLEINEESIKMILQRYVQPLVTDDQSSTLILVNSNKMKQTEDFLKKDFRITNVNFIKDIVKHLCR